MHFNHLAHRSAQCLTFTLDKKMSTFSSNWKCLYWVYGCDIDNTMSSDMFVLLLHLIWVHCIGSVLLHNNYSPHEKFQQKYITSIPDEDKIKGWSRLVWMILSHITTTMHKSLGKLAVPTFQWQWLKLELGMGHCNSSFWEYKYTS